MGRKEQLDIQDEFLNLCLSLKRVPEATEFYKTSGITREMVRQSFTKYTDMVEVLVERNKSKFKDIFTPEDFSLEKHMEFVKEYQRGNKKHILSFTAEPGAEVNTKLLATFTMIAKKTNAQIVCLVTAGDKMLLNHKLKRPDIHILCFEFHANHNLLFRPVEISITAVNPAKSFSKNTSSTGGAIVVPSPKQVMSLVANMDKLPRGTFSTGAITKPRYNQSISGYKAKDAHFYGAYLFKICSDKKFLPYNLDPLPDKCVVHLGVLYKPNNTSRKLKPEEIIRVDGDDHAMIRSKRVTKVLEQVQKQIKAHAKVSHDTWDMHISNHHNTKDKIHRAQMADKGHDKIEVERLATKAFLESESKAFDKVYCVISNHNEALARYGSEARYMDEDQNWKIGHHLALAQEAGIDPVEFAMNHYDSFKSFLDKYYKAIKADKPETFLVRAKSCLPKVHFLKVGEQLKFGGFKLNFHGDEGAGGSRGTADAMRVIHSGECANYDDGVITGHTHSSSKHNRSINVGTSTALPHEDDAPGYVKGSPNSWMNSFALVYQPKEYKGIGTAQLCLIIDEEF